MKITSYKDMKIKQGIHKIEKVMFYFLVVTLIVWNLFYINKGIDLTDTSYLCARYKYYFNTDVYVKSLGTFLTDLLGAAIYHLIPSAQVLTLSIVSWGMYLGSGVLIYIALKSYVPRVFLVLAVLGGSLFSFTWIHVMNYNATSMFVLTLSIYMLVKGIEREKGKYLLIAGFLFGINTLFRLPNILQICIGGSILWYYVFGKREIRKGMRMFKLYVLGVVFGLGLGIVLAWVILGKQEILEYFFRTLETSASTEDSHGIGQILSVLYIGAIEGLKSWVRYGVVLAGCSIIWFFIEKNKIINKTLKKLIYILVCAVMIYYGMCVGNHLAFITFFQMFGIAVLFVTLTGAFYYCKKKSFISTVCVMGFLAELVLCIGTNNGWYYQVVFMMVPLCICVLAVWKYSNSNFRGIVVLCTIFFLTLQFVVGYKFATGYVYRDEPYKELKYAVSVEEYKGVYTSKERAQYLDELVEILKPFEDEKLLAYGDFNIGYVITDMMPFFESIWSDLEGYSIEQFEYDLKTGIEKEGYPIVLLADVEKDGQYRDMGKLRLIEETLDTGRYSCYYENDWYKIYIPQNLTQ